MAATCDPPDAATTNIMKIGIVLHPYGEKHPAGLARTIFEFTKGMLERDHQNEYLIYIKSSTAPVPDLPGTNWRLHRLGEGRLWLDRLRKAPEADVYIFNTPVLPLLWKPPRSIVLALDFAYKHLPAEGIRDRLRRAVMAWYHARSMRRADAVVAISQATKDDAVAHYGIPADKITVIHCGFKPVCDTPETPIAVHEPFFLFVGIVKLRKNVQNIVRGFHEFLRAYPDASHRLLIGGNARGSYADSVRVYIAEAGLHDRVVFVGHLDDGTMSYLYRRASALVFPTLIEGFGFPILEAMHCGTPVITSDRSSLSEVAGDAALLVDPYKPQAIAEAMAKIAFEPATVERLKASGRKRATEFSWERAASKLQASAEQLFHS
jgi:glycosyltransferase involved in cell wall biosynthesis